MRHPRSSAERRHNRVVIMARRREIIRLWYSPFDTSRGDYPQDNSAWNRCAKWNLNCGSTMCHSGKYFSERRKRREQLKRDVFDDLRAWEVSIAGGWQVITLNSVWVTVRSRGESILGISTPFLDGAEISQSDAAHVGSACTQ